MQAARSHLRCSFWSGRNVPHVSLRTSLRCVTTPLTQSLVVKGRTFSTLDLGNLPKGLIDCDFFTSGEVARRADELSIELSRGAALDFDEIVSCHIGDPQSFGQEPALFHRQVLACLAEPSLAKQVDLFPEDVRERASRYLAGMESGHMGAYSSSQGHAVFRREVADFFTERDGVETDMDDIFLTDGASAAVNMVMRLAVGSPEDGILLPIPQYPLYTATMSLISGPNNHGRSVGYFLDEESGWTIKTEELERAVREFRAGGGKPRAIVVINPGNPTGRVFSREEMEGVLKFAEKEGVMVIADEGHQDNVHTDTIEWTSFRKLARELGTTVEVFSLHSVSKGVVGGGGLRGGAVHCENVAREVKDQLTKLASVGLCSNVFGQALIASALRPLPKGGPSWALQAGKRDEARAALKRRAKLVQERLSAIEGMECQTIEGATYAFPKLVIKGYVMKKAISHAKPADQVYCLELLERTGVMTIPGSSFGQKPGHFHFMLSLLHDEATLNKALDKVERFHKEHPHGWFK